MPKIQVSDLIQNHPDLIDFFWLFIRKIKAVSFIYLLVKPGYETFSLLLQDLNQFFDKSKFDKLYILNSILTSNIFLLRYIPNLSSFEKKNC